MHVINKIISVEPYRITVLFDKAEKRVINFDTLLQVYPVLKDEKVFTSVKLNDYPTLSWENAASIIDYDGSKKPAPLDFSPDSLYSLSSAIAE